MKTFRWLLIVVFCGTIVSSCFNPPEYPDIPEIVFKSVEFKKGGQPLPEGGIADDSIILRLTFKDGDGDVGVGNDELYPPFNDKWYFVKEPFVPNNNARDDCSFNANSYGKYRCWYIDSTMYDNYVRLSDRATFTGLDTAQSYVDGFLKPYNCINWVATKKDSGNTTIPFDTVYFQLNPHYNNIFVEFQQKTKLDDPVDPFETFDENQFFNYPNCGVRIFNGRIPILFDESGHGTPLEGEIRFGISSSSFQSIFGAKVLRLRAYIEDRALNRSNIVFTREFTLDEN